jgi:hypothetical protein
MMGRRSVALGIGIAILVSYVMAAIGFFDYGLPLLRTLGAPESLEAAQALMASREAFLWGTLPDLAIGGLILGSIVHATRTRQLAGSAKALWVSGLVLGNFITLPFYWYFRVWQPAALAPQREVSDQERLAAFLERRSQQPAEDSPQRGGPPN